MKNSYLILILLIAQSGFSQSLPIHFEGDVTTKDFVNFDGGVGIVTANPNPSGINTSDSVARIIRNEEAIWAGSKILLTKNLDFSVLTKISMKVYTSAPAGTKVKFKLEGSGSSVDVDAITTVSGAWETLEWTFVGIPNTLNEIVFMFDFGNVGDSSANSTFYFDDIEQVTGPKAPTKLSLPIDFEMGEVDTDFLNFSGATAMVIANPRVDGINPSAKVAQIIRDGGDFWAGSKIFIDKNIDFSTQWQISMKVYTTAPVGTRIKLELENADGKTNIDYLTTVSGSWETATWNFHKQASDYDRIQFLFDFGNIGDGTSTSIFLFDDIQQEVGPVIPEPRATTFPIGFESSVVTSDFINEDGGITTVIPNPYIDANNPSATVGKFVRSGGAPWAKSKLALTEFIPDFSTIGSISMKVYTDAPVGTILKFKIESNVAGFADERDALTTVSGEWATYAWDFTNFDNPIYNVLTLMLGYATQNDASAKATFLFDDIQRSSTLSDNHDERLNRDEVSIYPNPAQNQITVSSNIKMDSYRIFNALGKIVMNGDLTNTTINIESLKSGSYFILLSNNDSNQTYHKKFVK